MKRAALALLLLAAGPAAAQDALVGRWVGSYFCAQGETGMELDVAQGADRLRALFHFYPWPGNPGAAEGCFAMEGSLKRTETLGLAATRWILRPPNYVTVDLEGEVSADGTRFIGTVRGPGCTSFVLRRVERPGPMSEGCVRDPVVSMR